ncbi:hypothetical protein I5168_03980 [Nonlabens sp. SCSIO 43208]|uniref:hypothetical protein n=1 Tax=Nonlabens sp. SCSIO 43208 TaxID=2793009 RepID=UPI003D6A43FA
MKKSKLFYLTIAFVTIVIGMLASFILPDRFMFDAYTISLDRYNEKGWLGSYPFSMMIYHISGIGKLPFPAVALIQLPIIFSMFKHLKIPRGFHQFNLKNAIIWLGLLMFGIYVGFPSKEFITAIYIYLLSLVLISKLNLFLKIALTFLLLAFFGWFYRQYFLLIPFLALVIFGLSYIKIKNRVLTVLVVGILTTCFMSLSYGLVKGEFMSQGSREALNKRRVATGDSNADTIIVSPVETDTFHGEAFGIVYGFFTVNLPVTGLRFILKPHVIAFVIWQLGLFIYLLYLYSIVLKNKEKYLHEQWVFHLLFAYFVIQGVFEPDLGSAVKHKLGVFPWIWLAFYYNKGLIKRPTKIKRYVFKLAKNN